MSPKSDQVISEQSMMQRRCLLAGDLAIFLGGSEDSFTGALISLCGKADPANLAKLAEVFPVEVTAWRVWQTLPVPTFGELSAAIAAHHQAEDRAEDRKDRM